jgi:hypothetical protein
MARIDGRGRMRQVLKILPKDVRVQVRAAILESAEGVATLQRSLAPVRTGKLRASIKVTPGEQDPPAYAALKSKKNNYPDPELAAIISAGNSEVRTAHLVEFGSAPHSVAKGADRKTGFLQDKGPHHPGSQAHPFFFPGFRAMVKTAKRKINKAARKGIKDGLK